MSNVFVTKVLNFLTSEFNSELTVELHQALDDPQLDLSSHDDGTGISMIEEILRLPNFMRHIEDSTNKFDFICKLLTTFMKRSNIGPFTCYEIYQNITPFSKSATYMENLLRRHDVIAFMSSFEDFVQKCKLSEKYDRKISQFNFVVTRYDEIIESSDREKLMEISLRDDVLTGSEKFLQIATELSMGNVVDFLLKENSDLKMVEAMKTACVRGSHEFLSTFVSRTSSSDAIVGAQLLHKVCLELHTCQECDSAVNYQKCFSILVNKFPELANETDMEGNVPLHFAAKPKRNESEIVQLLQINGSALTARNASGKMPIDDLSLSCLKTFLDTCVKSNGSDSKIEIDYNFLIPHDQTKSKGWELILLGKLKDNLALRPLLTHPIISTFINLKWWNLRHFLAINFFVVLLFVLSMLVFIYSSRYKWNLVQSLSQVVFGLSTCLLFIREIWQLNTLGRNYFMDIKYGLINLSEWILIAGSAFSIIFGCDKYVSVPLILIAGFELFTLLGTLPFLCASMYLAILEKVVLTFFKASSLFLIIPLFFALSFNVFYARDQENVTEIDSSEQRGEAVDYNTYQSPWLSVVKVFAMMVGDLDSSNLSLAKSPFASILFLVFLFFVTIVLYNLLNALAISDTQKIIDEGEIADMSMKIKVLQDYEESMKLERSIFSYFENGKILIRLSDRKFVLSFNNNDDIEKGSKESSLKKILDRGTVEKLQDIVIDMKERREIEKQKLEFDVKIGNIEKLLKEALNLS